MKNCTYSIAKIAVLSFLAVLLPFIAISQDTTDCVLESLPGTDFMIVDAHDINFNEPPVTGTDDQSATVTVQRSGNFDINKVGTYIITYTGTDASGNTCTYVRTIKVMDRIDPVVNCMPATVEVNGTFDPMAGVSVSDNYYSASDFINGTNGCKIEIIANNVDISQPGTYQVCYRAIDGDGNISQSCCATITVNSQPTGIHDIKAGTSFEVYPNPTTGNFEIILTRNNQESVTVKITNMAGQTIKIYTRNDIANGRIAANLSGEAAGIYFVEIINNDNAGTKKLVLSK